MYHWRRSEDVEVHMYRAMVDEVMRYMIGSEN